MERALNDLKTLPGWQRVRGSLTYCKVTKPGEDSEHHGSTSLLQTNFTHQTTPKSNRSPGSFTVIACAGIPGDARNFATPEVATPELHGPTPLPRGNLPAGPMSRATEPEPVTAGAPAPPVRALQNSSWRRRMREAEPRICGRKPPQ